MLPDSGSGSGNQILALFRACRCARQHTWCKIPFSSSLQYLAHEGFSQSNILIDGEEQPILCDYGLALMSAKTAMSYRWAGPEILNPPEENADPFYTTESDVYAFAMTVLEVRFPLLLPS